MTAPADATREARSWLGRSEVPRGSNNVPGITDWYGMQDKWCAMFVSRVLFNVGLAQTASTSKGFSWTVAGMSWYQRLGVWRSGVDGCREGDVIFFKYGSSANAVDHVALVISGWNGSRFETIEGNWGDQVSHVRRTAKKVVGYGRPTYQLPAMGAGVAPPVPTVANPRTQVPGVWRAGDSNLGVAILQVRLNNLRGVLLLGGQQAWGECTVNANFDQVTLLNVVAFQVKFGLKDDGKFGPLSAQRMAQVEAFLGIEY